MIKQVLIAAVVGIAAGNNDGDDPNADSCIDPVLRTDIANALNKVVDHSCKDLNFCAYTGIVPPLIFDIRLGKIDMS
ncbi:hypothetical protein NECAME_00424 [Necator americanus]|uniref:Uncharacterized protein n=1 Tax=Necator americanus TaxID=51031 RepID=W2TDF3_NECAM|nr:hypothetical protein NECAME_00424 [Necator americanus]ETN79047.1 hypothetical protein NECAME_00424 [Necator americanus]